MSIRDYMNAAAHHREAPPTLRVRRVRHTDMPQVIALDEGVTGIAKPDYWDDVFRNYGQDSPREKYFLIAEEGAEGEPAKLLGFIIGEVRAWEFGSAPCGWVFALSVASDARLHGVGHALFAAISAEFKRLGMTKTRTMVARDNMLHSLFFRGEGMMAGPYIQLEKDIE